MNSIKIFKKVLTLMAHRKNTTGLTELLLRCKQVREFRNHPYKMELHIRCSEIN